MRGNILDGDNERVRAIHLLRAVRFHASWALKNNPTMDEVREREAKMTTGVTIGFEAHDENAGLAAILVTAYRFIFNPKSLVREKGKTPWNSLRRSEVHDAYIDARYGATPEPEPQSEAESADLDVLAPSAPGSGLAS